MFAELLIFGAKWIVLRPSKYSQYLDTSCKLVSPCCLWNACFIIMVHARLLVFVNQASLYYFERKRTLIYLKEKWPNSCGLNHWPQMCSKLISEFWLNPKVEGGEKSAQVFHSIENMSDENASYSHPNYLTTSQLTVIKRKSRTHVAHETSPLSLYDSTEVACASRW